MDQDPIPERQRDPLDASWAQAHHGQQLEKVLAEREVARREVRVSEGACYCLDPEKGEKEAAEEDALDAASGDAERSPDSGRSWGSRNPARPSRSLWALVQGPASRRRNRDPVDIRVERETKVEGGGNTLGEGRGKDLVEAAAAAEAARSCSDEDTVLIRGEDTGDCPALAAAAAGVSGHRRTGLVETTPMALPLGLPSGTGWRRSGRLASTWAWEADSGWAQPRRRADWWTLLTASWIWQA